MPITSIAVAKTKNENNASVIRKFSRKVRSSRIVRKVKDNRFFQREDSELRKKRRAIDKLQKREHYAHLKKLGKIS